jgi:hypothetical protein
VIRVHLAALVIALAGATNASGAVVASAVDEGEMPHAYAGGWIEKPRGAPRLEVKVWPAATVEVGVDVQCQRGRASRSAERDLALQVAPLGRRIALTMRRADQCYVSVSVYYEDVDQAGRIALKIFSATVPST